MSAPDNELHRKSIRIQGLDYSYPGYFFVTILCKNRLHRFGRITNGILNLNNLGKLANDCLLNIPNFHEYVKIHEAVVMPNHVHAIIQLMPHADTLKDLENYPKHISKDILILVEKFAQDEKSISNENIELLRSIVILPKHRQNQFGGTISGSLSSIVRGYKIGVSKLILEKYGVSEIWHRGFFENKIQDANAFRNITNYIKNNPANWKEDRFSN